MPTSSGGPGVRFPPPLLFIGGFALGWLLERYWHRLPLAAAGSTALERAGVIIVVAGFTLVVWGMMTFRAAGTAIIPNQPASRLVSSGPYRFTRNPMYVGFTVAYLGGVALVNSAWPLILLPIVLLLLIALVIRREETHLAEAFGADYESYRARVRRWM